MAFNSVELLEGDGDGRVDRQSCQLLGATALIVQGLMGIIVISSLLYKRHRESPKRPWGIWMFDVSKQILGQLFVHGLNVLISDLASHVAAGNACAYYFLNILTDTTLGVLVLYAALHALTRLFSHTLRWPGFESGQYGHPPKYGFWARQVAVYLACITAMKFVIVGLFLLWPGIFTLAEWFMGLLGDSEAVQVVFTMGLFPIAMNVIQFWLIDSIVKAHDGNWAPSNPDIFHSAPDTEPLFRAPDDDNDDDDDDDTAYFDRDGVRRLRLDAARRPDDAEAQRRSPANSAPALARRASPAPAGAGADPGAHAYPPPSSRPSSPPSRPRTRSPARRPDLRSTPSSRPLLSNADRATRPRTTTLHQPRAPSPTNRPHAPHSRTLSLGIGARRKTAPPAPLLPRSPMAPAINSPDLSAFAGEREKDDAHGFPSTTSASTRDPEHRQGRERGQEEKESGTAPPTPWAAWVTEDGEDWAARVGEEDWTGRRIEAARGAVQAAWT